MASNYVLESAGKAERSRELVFAGDGVRLAAQIEYPQTPSPTRSSFPLLFILPHAGCTTRATFDHYAQLALECGYAVFRWDKRGTGRSGAGGRGSTTQDAVNAYEAAIGQPYINRDQVVILAQAEGTLMLGEAYGLFARVRHPRGVILSGSMLDEHAVLAIDAPVQILLGTEDWIDPEAYALRPCIAHKSAYTYGASYYVAPNANRLLLVGPEQDQTFHPSARQAMHDWLSKK